jgi:hypothetical protein
MPSAVARRAAALGRRAAVLARVTMTKYQDTAAALVSRTPRNALDQAIS